MFNNQRYTTSGIANELDLAIQILLWELIDELKTKQEVDYLQVFDLEASNIKGVTVQIVKHHQECPPYFKKYNYRYDKPISGRKIFVIDDQTHSTMLFAEEY